jgi:hypothetical protein
MIRRDWPDRQQRARARQAVGSPPQPNRMKSPGRRRAIAFPFRGLDTGPAQGGADGALSCDEPRLRAMARADVHMDCGQRRLARCVVLSARHELSPSSQAQMFQLELTIALTFCALTFCRRTIFSENRFPLCRIML